MLDSRRNAKEQCSIWGHHPTYDDLSCPSISSSILFQAKAVPRADRKAVEKFASALNADIEQINAEIAAYDKQIEEIKKQIEKDKDARSGEKVSE